MKMLSRKNGNGDNEFKNIQNIPSRVISEDGMISEDGIISEVGKEYICHGLTVKPKDKEEDAMLKLIQSEEAIKTRSKYLDKGAVSFSAIKNSDPLAMGIFIQINKLKSISISKKLFHASFRIILKWKIPIRTESQKYLEEEHIPQLFFANIDQSIDFKKGIEVEKEASYIGLDGALDADEIHMSCSDKEIHRFPFDSYYCCISVTYSSRNKSDYRLRRFSKLDDTSWLRNTPKILDFGKITNEWYVFTPEIRCATFEPYEGTGGIINDKDTAQIVFKIQRKPFYYFSNFLIYATILSSMSLFSFAMDLRNEGISNRITYVITVSLTLVALLLSSQFDIPKSSSSNMITIYVNICFIFTFGMMFGMCYISNQDNDESMIQSDLNFRNACISIWATFNGLYYFHFCYNLYTVFAMKPLSLIEEPRAKIFPDSKIIKVSE